MVAELPHASVTVHVLVTEKLQPDPVSAPSTKLAVSPVEQLSVTLATPNALAISAVVGLQLSCEEAVTVIIGACISLVKFRVCEVVAELPHASVTVHVLVTEKL